MKKSFAKTLSGNDVGETGSHQAGICVPKKNQDLLSFFPQLDVKIKNPDCWLICEDENGDSWKLRFVYYNSKTLGVGTRNEYRITHLTSYLKKVKAKCDDQLVFTKSDNSSRYSIRLFKHTRADLTVSDGEDSSFNKCSQAERPKRRVVKLRGWQRIH